MAGSIALGRGADVRGESGASMQFVWRFGVSATAILERTAGHAELIRPTNRAASHPLDRLVGSRPWLHSAIDQTPHCS